VVERNQNIAKLPAGYLFPEIGRRRREFQENNPDAKVISMGIGDTTEPLPPHICESLMKSAVAQGTPEGYTGYGDDSCGETELRELVAKKMYNGIVSGDEVFISDGAKPDTGRLQMLFGGDVTIAVQDPSYPVYVDSSVMMGQTGDFNETTRQFDNIVYMPCTPENNFFPDLLNTARTDLIFFCSPNNPTGSVATADQLAQLVKFAKANKSIIIFDAAYSQYIRGKSLPRSIFEIEGAREVAIEVNSFSKSVGFTGARLGWAVVPKELKYNDGSLVAKDWNRVISTVFNGASNIVQQGGKAALDEEGLKEMKCLVNFYMENTKIIRTALQQLDFDVFGGLHAPYIWARVEGKTSWQAFEEILRKAHIVTTPGVGFGPSGEGFIRFSAFGTRANVNEAVERLKKLD
jgi:LL-diaminopimelate aminotransferase